MANDSTRVALLNVMKTVALMGLMAFAVGLVTPTGPDSPRMIAFIIVLSSEPRA